MLDALARNSGANEKDVHKAIENSLWVLGGRFHVMASNKTLRPNAEDYTSKTHVGPARQDKRPDLLLATDAAERYLLIEFKRPSHAIDRQDGAQAREYRDELAVLLLGKAIDVVVIGGRRVAGDSRYDTQDLRVLSYSDVISQARHELSWLISNLSR